MNDIKAIERAVRNTLFIATNLEDIEGVLQLGWVEQAVIARGPERLHKYLHPNIYIHELATGRREKTISELFHDLTPIIHRKMNACHYVWTFRPYNWLDDFLLFQKQTLNWNYYFYTYWSGKQHQKRLLLENGDAALRMHLLQKEKHLRQRIIAASQLSGIEQNSIIFRKESTGGRGVFLSKTVLDHDEYSNDFAYRVEQAVSPHATFCQVAVVLDGNVVTYEPSVMMMDIHNGHYKLLGNDFLCRDISKNHWQQVNEITQSVGKALSKAGFVGVFNCDFLHDIVEDRIYFVEVNPRNSGCTFIIDKLFSDYYMNGDVGSIYNQPTFLNYYVREFGQFPSKIKNHVNGSCIDLIFPPTSHTGFEYIESPAQK